MEFIGYSLILIGLALFVLLTAAAYTVYGERKVAALIQQRVGPNRVGLPLSFKLFGRQFGPFKLWGLLQPLADVIKLLLKEDIVPTQANKLIHFAAPVISVVIALVTMAVIPFSKGDVALTEGTGGFLVIADVNIGILYILAITSISVYGVTLAGWASNSKYSLLGGLRASAQMISYELAMGLAVVSVILLSNFSMGGEGDYLKLTSIVESQSGWWNIFRNPLGFFIFTTAAFAEANRTPFDLVEAEQELVGGFHTEYSSMKFALFFVAEYIHVIIASTLITTLFFGGYLAPAFIDNLLGVTEWSGLGHILWGLLWFGLKTLFWMFVFLWVRWTLPRFKYNQLMDLGWKKMLPLALLNLMVVAFVIALLA